MATGAHTPAQAAGTDTQAPLLPGVAAAVPWPADTPIEGYPHTHATTSPNVPGLDVPFVSPDGRRGEQQRDPSDCDHNLNTENVNTERPPAREYDNGSSDESGNDEPPDTNRTGGPTRTPAGTTNAKPQVSALCSLRLLPRLPPRWRTAARLSSPRDASAAASAPASAPPRLLPRLLACASQPPMWSPRIASAKEVESAAEPKPSWPPIGHPVGGSTTRCQRSACTATSQAAAAYGAWHNARRKIAGGAQPTMMTTMLTTMLTTKTMMGLPQRCKPARSAM